MNTIKEILENKKKELCNSCSNKHNELDLCNIRIRMDNTADCINYKRCMSNKCNNCQNYNKCFKEGATNDNRRKRK